MSDPQNHYTKPEVTEGYGHSFTYYRWKPYKPAHTKQSSKIGRWQKMNEYGGFENCEAPASLHKEPVDVAGMKAENERLRKLLRTSRKALDNWLVTYASDMCRDDDVRRSQAEISEAGGTLAYISDLQENITDAINDKD